MTAQTSHCPKHVRAGRLRKADQFLSVAGDVLALADADDDIGDAYVTLCIHAGIAAADVVCCAGLGLHASGPNHNDAIDLLARVDKEASKQLKTLLDMKTKAGYLSVRVSADEVKRATRAAESLVAAARRSHATAG